MSRPSWSRCLAMVFASLAACLLAWVQLPGRQVETSSTFGRKLSDVHAPACGKVDEFTKYEGEDLSKRFGIWSASQCAAECWLEPACKAYTLARFEGVCHLKSDAAPKHKHSIRCTSGVKPCRAPPTPAPHKVYNYSDTVMQGVAYAAMPCTSRWFCFVSEDIMQEGYQALWGPPPARNDLQVIKDLGANTVRLYHSIGLDGPGNHGLFLDRAEDLGLDVMPGYHTSNAINGDCPHFDCYHAWKSYTLKAFRQGFRRNDSWHPAVSTLLLFNELDFFRGYGRAVHARAAISALDGVLAAEREAGVEPGRVRLSISWSNSPGTSLDGQVSGFAIWAFQDVASCVREPALAGYVPRTPQKELEEAYRTRWAHSINVQTLNILGYMQEHYNRFEPTPWFIGEYSADTMSKGAIEKELRHMDASATDVNDPFMGMNFFQFQTSYFKGGYEMNVGLFRLGRKKVGETGEVCDKGIHCEKHPVHCLTTDLGGYNQWFLQPFAHKRANAVAAAWGGMINQSLMCQ